MLTVRGFPHPESVFGYVSTVLPFAPSGVTLTGTQVTLVPTSRDHVDSLWGLGQESEIWTWMINKPPSSREEFLDWLEPMFEAQAEGKQEPFTAIAADGRIAGSTRLFDFRPADRGVEIGYTWYGSEFRGTLLNAECKLLLLTHAFETLDANRVQLKTDSRNERSRRAMLKMGAQFEGILRRYQTRFDGTTRDTAMFSVTHEDWPTVKAGLLARLAN